jgi:hypothetical protein
MYPDRQGLGKTSFFRIQRHFLYISCWPLVENGEVKKAWVARGNCCWGGLDKTIERSYTL